MQEETLSYHTKLCYNKLTNGIMPMKFFNEFDMNNSFHACSKCMKLPLFQMTIL